MVLFILTFGESFVFLRKNASCEGIVVKWTSVICFLAKDFSLTVFPYDEALKKVSCQIAVSVYKSHLAVLRIAVNIWFNRQLKKKTVITLTM